MIHTVVWTCRKIAQKRSLPEGLQQVHQLDGGDHGHGLDVGRDVAQDGQQAVEERLQPLENGMQGDPCGCGIRLVCKTLGQY